VATIEPSGIPSAEAFGTVTILMSSNLWIWWAEIAIDNEASALEARARAVAIGSSSDEFGQAFAAEARASMVAVSASAHALDALYGALQDRLPPSTAERRPSRILETLRSGVELRGRAGGGRWATEFAWLFDLRDAAVHHEEQSRPSVAHPTGVNSSAENALYSLEAASRAVDFMLEVFSTCVEKPRAPLEGWAAERGHVVPLLIERRSA
jgi:hypothetical protein